ncbi:MAG: 5'/3'-nucleotidase SurE [Pseudomonadota bacterium]
MFVLISNDDGYDAPGLAILERAAREVFDEVAVVAPLEHQSAMSHAVTLNRPVLCRGLGHLRWAIAGTPSDCVFLALHHLLDRKPDLVLSGINNGPNLGYDTIYSGTVAAAREGLMNDVPALSFSLAATRRFDHEHCFEPVRTILRAVREAPPLPSGTMLNVNIPSYAEYGPPVGYRACSLGTRVFANQTSEWTDPQGNQYLWLGGSDLDMKGGEDADTYWIGQGYVTVTPLTWDLYARPGRRCAEGIVSRLDLPDDDAMEVRR